MSLLRGPRFVRRRIACTMMLSFWALSCGHLAVADGEAVNASTNGPTIRPLLGVNSGPGAFHPEQPATRGFVDLTEQYQKIGVEVVRLDDYFGAFDIMCYFPVGDVEALPDPTLPVLFDWAETDAEYRKVLDGGFQPLLRIGQGWRNMRSWGPFGLPVTSYPDGKCPFWPNIAGVVGEIGPQLMLETVAHLNDESLWGRRPLDGNYVEIWNEANILGLNSAVACCCQCNDSYTCDYIYPNYEWDGTPEEFYAFYADSALALKAAFPQIKIGGPGLQSIGCGVGGSDYANTIGLEWTKQFLAYIRDRAVPLDFFSWHVYSADPAMFVECYETMESLLAEFGYIGVEHVVSEYNTNFVTGNVSRVIGAAQNTAIWITLQKETPAVSMAAIYRGNDGPFVRDGIGFPLCVDYKGKSIPPPDPPGSFTTAAGVGLFHGDGTEKPVAAAFEFWSKLVNLQRVDLSSYFDPKPQQGGTLYFLGGLGEGAGRLEILLAYLSSSDTKTTVDLAPIAAAYGLPNILVEAVEDENKFPVEKPVSGDDELELESNAFYRVQLTPDGPYS